MFTFPSASDSRSASDLKILFEEYCAIGTAILDARCDGDRIVTICNSTMTNSTAYYNAYFVETLDPCDFEQQQILDLQQAVIDCWTQLGYSIKRITDTNTGTTFCWELRW